MTKQKALEISNVWKGYIDKAFTSVTIEDKQFYNEQEMIENGFPEIIYTVTYKNYEQLNYAVKKNMGKV